MAFVMKFMTLSVILYIFRHSIIQVYVTISSVFLWSIQAKFFRLVLASDLSIGGHLFLLFVLFLFFVFCDILFVLPSAVFKRIKDFISYLSSKDFLLHR